MKALTTSFRSPRMVGWVCEQSSLLILDRVLRWLFSATAEEIRNFVLLVSTRTGGCPMKLAAVRGTLRRVIGELEKVERGL